MRSVASGLCKDSNDGGARHLRAGQPSVASSQVGGCDVGICAAIRSTVFHGSLFGQIGLLDVHACSLVGRAGVVLGRGLLGSSKCWIWSTFQLGEGTGHTRMGCMEWAPYCLPLKPDGHGVKDAKANEE